MRPRQAALACMGELIGASIATTLVLMAVFVPVPFYPRGIGNIYRSEILYLLNMHPNRIAKSLSRSEFDALWKLSVDLLHTGKRYNRIITTTPADVGKPRSRMNRDERLQIYKKKQCPQCTRDIVNSKLAARTVFACPACQPQESPAV
jgi:endonuclease-8